MSDTHPAEPVPAPADAPPRPQRRLPLGVILGIERAARPVRRSVAPAAAALLLLLACGPDPDSTGPTALSTRANAGNVGYFALIVDSVIDLGMLPGGLWSLANDVNNAGVAVGITGWPAGSGRATLWNRPAPPQDLGVLGRATGSLASGISDAGVVVGQSSPPLGLTAFRWTASTGMTKLLTQMWVPAANSYWTPSQTFAAGISGDGHITGAAYSPTVSGYKTIPFLYTPGARQPFTGLLSNGCDGTGESVNDAGQVTAYTTCQVGGTTWYNSSLWVTAGWSTIPGVKSLNGINNAGTVVGDFQGHAVRWSSGGGPVDLLPLPDGAHKTSATDVNNFNYTVGIRQDTSGSTSEAFVEGGGLPITALPSLNSTCGGPKWDFAEAINDSKVIVGYSNACDGQRHAVMWKVHIVFVPQTPGPPPSP